MTGREEKFITVLNKIDLVPKETDDVTSKWFQRIEDKNKNLENLVVVSCAESTGIDQLETRIADQIQSMLQSDEFTSEDGILITRERHRFHLLRCVEHLERFLFEQLPMDAAAEEIR
jgi:tRNA modification GTPase